MVECNSTIKNKILFINLGWEQESYIDILCQLGCEIYCVNSTHCEVDSRIKGAIVCDYFDVNKIMEFSLVHNIDTVITDQCDFSIYAAAVVSELLGCNGIGIEQALLTTNKYLQRERVSESNSNILQPNFTLCLSIEQAKQFCERFGFPAILKPVDSRGSFGVTKVSTEQEIEMAFLSAIGNSSARQVIIEEFIEGLQITVDGYADPVKGVKSLALATKQMIDDQTQVSIGINYPGFLTPSVYRKALINNERVAEALGISFGMIHAEYMVDANDDIYLIEIANRGGGCFTSTDILKSVTNFDFAKKLVMDSIGIANDVDYSEISSNKTNLLFFKLPVEGVVNEISLNDGLEELNGLINFKIMVNVGVEIELTSNDANRHGFIIVSEDSESLLVKNVLSSINFKMSDGRVVNPVLY